MKVEERMQNPTILFNSILIAIVYLSVVGLFWFARYKSFILASTFLAILTTLIIKFGLFIIVPVLIISIFSLSIALLLYTETQITYKLLLGCILLMGGLLIMNIQSKAQYFADLFFLLIFLLVLKETISIER